MEILRNYLEIKSIKKLNEVKKPIQNCTLNLEDSKDFHLNKFLYKQIGRKYNWTDRLIWSDKKWISYVFDKSLTTYVLKINNDLAGYFELIFHEKKLEVEIAYLGILEEYFGKKLGAYLLSEAIKKSFLFKPKRIWVHTCSLDHKYALKNYLARGMIVYKTENLIKESA
tara:strand:- start:59 stop:565 length:507 start_codon:yes stop_codon:yes gene_type:complete